MFGRVTLRSRIIYQVLATVLILPFALPLFWIVTISFQGQGAMANYAAVLTETPFLRFIVNSVIISAGTVLIVTACTVLAGFALAKLDLPGKQLLFLSIVAGLMLPSIALTVPMFIVVRELGLFNNYVAVIGPLAAVIMPMTILLTRNFMANVPDELIDAAKIDGATTFVTLVRVVVPLSKAIVAVVVIWSFLNAWNEFFLPLLFMHEEEMQAITQIPTYFTSTYGSDVPKIFAALTLMCLPIVVTYLTFQRQFERGLTAGALK
ncbi:carbohydrate ABC transporter permease [Ruania alba]|uniref:Carbohydrate ABC transporter membrane protein 2, CUT1 family n=1 Tax=Ruania alba TaxID=648782 RepID=A0A1H5GXS0_9MICO|nr:carbohydrate ABC transporter permease [Ruania alba]SEE20526.1 carbohydrate ABC transporter membrane protein 2, CUT1 family [Ruania alba]